jgi:hypothetical protein
MTKEDIKELRILYQEKMNDPDDRMIDYAFKRGAIMFLSIIAAQLAELNESLKFRPNNGLEG